MLRDALVIVHAGAGVGGLLAGLPILSPRLATAPSRQWVRWLYAAFVAVLLLSMVVLIVLDWPQLAAGARIAFTGLSVLGAVITYRLARAHQEVRRRAAGWAERYLDHLGFTYISLWVGFLVVPALGLPAPQIAVPAVVVGTIGLGHLLIARYRRRMLGAPDDENGAADSVASSC